MKSRAVLTLMTLILSPIFARAAVIAQGTFKPDDSAIEQCRSLGFYGNFVLSDREASFHIGDFVFTDTKRSFVLLKRDATNWKMEIWGTGTWSEMILLDLKTRVLNYASQRPKYEGSCKGTLQD